MAYKPAQGKTAVGLFVDGQQLKYVQLSLTGGKIVLRDFRTVLLEGKLEDKATAAASDGSWPAVQSEDAGLTPPSDMAMVPSEAPTKDVTSNASVLLSLLGDLPPKHYTVSIALSEPAVRFYEFESDFGLTGTKLKKKIVAELAATRGEAPSFDSLGIIRTSMGRVLCIVRQGGLQLYDLLSEAQGFTNSDLPTIKLIHSSDLALMEFIRASYELKEDELSVIVYVGHDFSRVIFMQGYEYLHHAPIISEGFNAENIDNTIYSRIRLEQENPALQSIDRIFLAGESHKVNLSDAMASHFPDARVEYLQSLHITLSPESEPTPHVISEYVIPLAVAWRALQSNLRGSYGVNLIPASIVENQRAFSFTWYGWLGAGLILASLVFFSATLIPRASRIQAIRSGLGEQHEMVAQLESFTARKDSLQAEINKYDKAMKLYNTMMEGSGRWTRILNFLSSTLKDLNSIWIESIRPVEGNPTEFDLGGRAYVRARVTKLVNSFEKASLRQLRTVTVGKRDLYEFDIRVEKVSKDDVPYIPPRGSSKK